MKNVWVESTFCNLECIREFERRGVSIFIPSFHALLTYTLLFSALLYATIFGHVTTIIQQMTSATAKYHDILNR